MELKERKQVVQLMVAAHPSIVGLSAHSALFSHRRHLSVFDAFLAHAVSAGVDDRQFKLLVADWTVKAH